MAIPQRFSRVTLGVADVEAATAFYRRLGWREAPSSVVGEVAFFATPGGVLALWETAELAKDAALPTMHANAPSFRAVALAINLGSRDKVDDAVGDWVLAGGSISRAAAETEWGGYSGYVADPDGNLWELAHNPSWPRDERGLPLLHGA
ncbi:VOC family protein [Agromyces badenianii]|uniref:VOC family protein n=1 Tax=Agromyces badenianii TaxID=2080742 RepID=UPI000D599E00|nr:VOC family protein [Agromyces badenianii]PWC04885.1 glyoxalase [Agromyces badenianii]